MTANPLRKSIDDILASVSKARVTCSSFPELQNTPTPRLGLNFFIPTSVGVKNALLQDLDLLEQSIEKTAQRVDLPLLVGVIGKFSSGKSTLLNAYFRIIFGPNVPDYIKRKTGNTPTDQSFTYITHRDYAHKFAPSADIEVVPVNHDLFHDINFIDTPGTGWKAFTKHEVSELLSAADIMLFLFRPNELLDALSVGALHVKFTTYETIPLWYVVTNALDYTELGKWDTLRLQEFADDLKTVKEKLQTRPCANDEDQIARNVVVQRVNFIVKDNTFLVDGLYDYGVAPLLQRIRDAFGTEKAKDEKRAHLRQIVGGLHEAYEELLTKAEQHISRLADVLQTACSTVIKADSSKFTTTTIVSESALLSQTMYAQLRQEPLRSDDGSGYPAAMVPTAYAYEAPEILMVKRQVDEMRQEKLSYNFEYSKPDILFGAWVFDNQMERMKADVITALKRELDRSWNQLLPRLLGDGRVEKLSAVAEHTSDLVNAQITSIDGEIREYFNRQRAPVVDCLRRPTQKLIRLYHDNAIETTIFTRQVSLLAEMKREIPTMCDEIREGVVGMARKANDYTASMVDRFDSLIEKRLRLLLLTTEQHLNENVYFPTKESLDFLFADREALLGHAHREKPLALHGDDLRTQYSVAAIRNAVGKEITDVRQRAEADLAIIEATWQREWTALDRDFHVLTASAKEVSQRLTITLNAVDRVIDDAKAEAFSLTGTSVMALKGKLQRILEYGSQFFASAVAEAKKVGRTKRMLEYIGVALGIGGPAMKIWQSQAANKPEWLLNISLAAVGIAIAVWMVGRILLHRATFDRLVERIYMEKRDALIAEMEQELQAKKERIKTEFDQRNNRLRSELQRLFDDVIDTCERVNKELMPALDNQIRIATKLAIDTTKRATTIRNTTTARMMDVANGHLNRSAEEVEIRVRNGFTEMAEILSSQYTTKLDKYIDVYRSLAKEVAKLLIDVRKGKSRLEGNVTKAATSKNTDTKNQQG